MNELNNKIEDWVDELQHQLSNELREYHSKYPDADYMDLSGYLVGLLQRPQTAQSLQALISEQVRLGREAHFQAIVPDEGVDEDTKGTFADGYSKAIEDVCDNHYAQLKSTKEDV